MGSAFRFVRFRCSLDGVYFRYGLQVRTMSRLRLRPRGFIPDIAFGREPSNSTSGTFTHVDASFSSARPSSALTLQKLRQSLRSWGSALLGAEVFESSINLKEMVFLTVCLEHRVTAEAFFFSRDTCCAPKQKF